MILLNTLWSTDDYEQNLHCYTKISVNINKLNWV